MIPVNTQIETVEYEGIVYEKRSIARGEFRETGMNILREDLSVNVGDLMFFIDPRNTPESHLHNQLITVLSFDPSGGMRTEEDGTSYVLCCFHRVISAPDEVDEKDFNAVFD